MAFASGASPGTNVTRRNDVDCQAKGPYLYHLVDVRVDIEYGWRVSRINIDLDDESSTHMPMHNPTAPSYVEWFDVCSQTVRNCAAHEEVVVRTLLLFRVQRIVYAFADPPEMGDGLQEMNSLARKQCQIFRRGKIRERSYKRAWSPLRRKYKDPGAECYVPGRSTNEFPSLSPAIPARGDGLGPGETTRN